MPFCRFTQEKPVNLLNEYDFQCTFTAKGLLSNVQKGHETQRIIFFVCFLFGSFGKMCNRATLECRLNAERANAHTDPNQDHSFRKYRILYSTIFRPAQRSRLLGPAFVLLLSSCCLARNL